MQPTTNSVFRSWASDVLIIVPGQSIRILSTQESKLLKITKLQTQTHQVYINHNFPNSYCNHTQITPILTHQKASQIFPLPSTSTAGRQRCFNWRDRKCAAKSKPLVPTFHEVICWTCFWGPFVDGGSYFLHFFTTLAGCFGLGAAGF